MTSKVTSQLCSLSVTSLLKFPLPLPCCSHLYGTLRSFSMQLACLSEENHPHSFQRFHIILFHSLMKGLGMHNQLHTICQSTETTMASLRLHQSWQWGSLQAVPFSAVGGCLHHCSNCSVFTQQTQLLSPRHVIL